MSTLNNPDFGELENDTKFKNVIEMFEIQLKKIENSLNVAVNFQNYEQLTAEEKVKFDTYLAYTITSLYWMNVKLQGLETNEQDVKKELDRIKQAMNRERQILEKSTLRPILDKGAASRFIKHGLKIPKDKSITGASSSKSS